MKLVYEVEKRFRVLFPIDKMVEKGTTIETDSKEIQKRLKELGFKEVKPKTQKDGDK